MRKDRVAYFRKRLVEKQRQLVDEVGRSALYGKDQEDDSIKDLGDQANTAYNREFIFELGNGDRRLLREVVTALQKLDEGSFGSCERCGEPISDKRLEALPFAVRFRHSMPTLIRTVRALASVLAAVNRLLGAPRAESGGADPGVVAVMGLAADAGAAGRYADAVSLYREALQRNRYYLPALRALRDLAVESGRWQDALEPERRLLALVPAAERPREAEWLATIYYA